MFTPTHAYYAAVGVTTRAISVAADIAVLGFTLWKTFYIFKIDEETRETMKFTTTLAYTGNMPGLLFKISTLINTFHLGTIQFGYILSYSRLLLDAKRAPGFFSS